LGGEHRTLRRRRYKINDRMDWKREYRHRGGEEKAEGEEKLSEGRTAVQDYKTSKGLQGGEAWLT